MLDVLGFFRLLFREGTEVLDTDDSLRSVVSPPGVKLADSGLVGFDLPVCLGGCGNAPILTVFRRDLPAGSAPAGPSSDGSAGTEGESACLGPGR